MNFQRIYESAMKERERALQEDNSSYELVDPEVGLQPPKKVVVMDPKDNRTQYVYPDRIDVTEWYGV
jgi:hypothetical protein